MNRRTLQQVWACALCLAMSGCGNGLAQVSGLVTLDGKPLGSGDNVRTTVIFQPVASTGTKAAAIVDENGRYQLSTGSQEGIPPGEYIVTCTSAQVIPPKDPWGTPSGKQITSTKYSSAATSRMSFTVQAGSNEYDIPLKSRP